MEELAKLEEERGTDGYVSEDRRKEPESRDFERKGCAGSGDRARYFKKDEEGRKIMSKIME